MADADGLEAFDGFTRKMASAGMFNDDQVDHMRYLSSLPREARCRCGWYAKGECVSCNIGDFAQHGVVNVPGRWDGNSGSTWDGRSWRQHGSHSALDWRLPSGIMTGYKGAIEWVKRRVS